MLSELRKLLALAKRLGGEGAAANGWPGTPATGGLGAATGRAGAGLTGAGAGWADARDENANDAAATTRNLQVGINVTAAIRESASQVLDWQGG